jgi:hypothetical protein
VPLYVGHGFSRERNNKTCCNFYMKKAMLIIYRMMSRMLGLGGWNTASHRLSGCWNQLLFWSFGESLEKHKTHVYFKFNIFR